MAERVASRHAGTKRRVCYVNEAAPIVVDSDDRDPSTEMRAPPTKRRRTEGTRGIGRSHTVCPLMGTGWRAVGGPVTSGTHPSVRRVAAPSDSRGFPRTRPDGPAGDHAHGACVRMSGPPSAHVSGRWRAPQPDSDWDIVRRPMCLVRRLGEGGYGCVYRAVCEDGSYRAIKLAKRPWCASRARVIVRETMIHGLLARHPHVVRLDHATLFARVSPAVRADRSRHQAGRRDDGRVALVPVPGLVLESMVGDARDVATRSCDPAYRCTVARLLLLHVLRALADMHALGIVHRDVKPENVLYAFRGGGGGGEPGSSGDWAPPRSETSSAETAQAAMLQFKLADMGMARFITSPSVIDSPSGDGKVGRGASDEGDSSDGTEDWEDECGDGSDGAGMTANVCTHAYKAPEIALSCAARTHGTYDGAIDLWGLGLVAVEVLTGTKIGGTDRHHRGGTHGERHNDDKDDDCDGAWPPFDVDRACREASGGHTALGHGQLTAARVLCELARALDFSACARSHAATATAARDTPLAVVLARASRAREALGSRAWDLARWLRQQGARDVDPDDPMVDLLGRMLEPDPARRITAREALAHPIFADRGPTPDRFPWDSRRGRTGKTSHRAALTGGETAERTRALGVARSLCEAHALGALTLATCVDLVDACIAAANEADRPTVARAGEGRIMAIVAAALAVASTLRAPAGRAPSLARLPAAFGLWRYARARPCHEAVSEVSAGRRGGDGHTEREERDQHIMLAAIADLLEAIDFALPHPDTGVVGFLMGRRRQGHDGLRAQPLARGDRTEGTVNTRRSIPTPRTLSVAVGSAEGQPAPCHHCGRITSRRMRDAHAHADPLTHPKTRDTEWDRVWREATRPKETMPAFPRASQQI